MGVTTMAPERKCLKCSHAAVDGMLYCVYHLAHFHESVLTSLPQESGMEVSGNGAFYTWFIKTWPEPKKSSGQHSNWVYKRETAHAGWCAALRGKP